MFVIFGATGKVGRAAVTALRSRGEAVRALVRDPTQGDQLRALGCDVAVADLNDATTLRTALEGSTAAQVICPVPASAADPLSDMRRTIDTIADALTAAAVPAILAISDYGAELSEGTGITLAFHHLEARLSAIPAPLTLLRSSEHMQNWARVIAVAASTGILPTLHHPATKLFPTISAPDLGVIAADLLLTPFDGVAPRVVHVEGPRRYSAHDAAVALERTLDRPVAAHELPRSQWMETLMRGGLSSGYASLVCDLYDAHNAGRIDAETAAGPVRCGSTELAEAFAALRPSITT